MRTRFARDHLLNIKTLVWFLLLQSASTADTSPFHRRSSHPFSTIKKFHQLTKSSIILSTMTTMEASSNIGSTLPRITTPTLIVDKSKVVSNIQRMAAKASPALKLRPHCKTHASIEIANWLQQNIGPDKFGGITTSSLSMAEYFAPNIKDVTVAFPLNVLEVDKVQRILDSSEDMKLNVLVENVEGVQALAAKFATLEYANKLGIFIKIDVGYGRTGIPAEDYVRIDTVVQQIKDSGILTFKGFLTHAGHTYHCSGAKEIQDIYDQTTPMMLTLKEIYISDFPNLILSMGDTPTCSVVEDMSVFDEIRPGNFVFYDLEQASIGACTWNDIAVAVSCPIVAKHPQRREIIVYGGGVHCSKDRLSCEGDPTIFGRVAKQLQPGSFQWGPIVDGMYVRSLSQEHGIIVVPESEDFDSYEIGQLLFLVPVHSCMTADCLKHQGYITTDGKHIERMKN